VASWASLDYYGRWKALHYAARRFYAPVLLSVEDSGSRMNVHLTSDLMTPWDGKVCWRLETLNGKRFESGEQIVRAQALADILVCTPDFSNHVNEANKRELIFICELWQDEAMLSWLVIPFVPNKHLKLADPKLTAKVRLEGSQLSFDLSARTLARFVELELEGADAVFSDNYFDISAGQKVTITCPIPPGWTLEKAQRALKVRSLYQSFA
jgi:beta-mannosidase